MVKIYGVVEQADIALMSPPGADGRIKEDHSDLLKIVRKINGVNVGLGTCRDFAQIQGNRHFAKPALYQDLEKRLQPQSHIVYLDNEGIFADICFLADSLQAREMSPLERFRKKNKHDYLFNIERSAAMLRKLGELHLDAAFIGQGNLGEYILNPGLLKGQGHEVLVEVPVNYKEVKKAVREASFSYYKSSSHSKREFNRLKRTIPPLKFELFRPEKIPKAWLSMTRSDFANQTLIQRHNSIINNYIVESSEMQPDYIGTWSAGLDWKVPAQGYFELFITVQQGSDVKGIIKDAYGDATFTGTLVENPDNGWHGFKFNKIYDKKAHKDAKSPILYDGSGVDDWFMGHWIYETEKPLKQIEGAGPVGEFFEMVKYAPGKSQIIINAENGTEMERELTRKNKSPLQAKPLNPP